MTCRTPLLARMLPARMVDEPFRAICPSLALVTATEFPESTGTVRGGGQWGVISTRGMILDSLVLTSSSRSRYPTFSLCATSPLYSA